MSEREIRMNVQISVKFSCFLFPCGLAQVKSNQTLKGAHLAACINDIS